MALTSLIVCADAKTVQVLSRILHDLGLEVEHWSDPPAAVGRLVAQRFDAIVVDCKDQQAGLEFIATSRKTLANKTALVIAIVDRREQVSGMFARGANFILYKPVSAERARSSLAAARSMMRREKRGNQRIPLHTQASMAYANIENAPTTLVDLSEDGVAIQAARKLPSHCKVYFEFTLPGQVSTIRLSGEVMWQDASGRVGIRFADVPQSSRRVLREWINASLAQQVEAKHDLPPASEEPGTEVRETRFALPISLSKSNRRVQSRYACRMGAEVHYVGGNVPYRCTLSDISTGGCYVETTEPFAPGTAVDIVVRTQEMKLRVRGTVQAMHPGFGMGVEFSLKTAHEREQVKRLIACQASQPGTPLEPRAR